MAINAGGNRGVGKLEQDGSAPTGDDDHLAIDLPGRAPGAGPHVVRTEQARAHRFAMALQRLDSCFLRYHKLLCIMKVNAKAWTVGSVEPAGYDRCMRISQILFLLLVAGANAAFAKGLPTIEPADALARPGPIARGDDADAATLIGMKAPALPKLRWLDGQSRSLEAFEGKVVVIRSFTNDCPFCASTMPSLQALSQRYEDQDVVVLGVYHPKPPARLASRGVAAFAKSLGVTFPVAVDEDWSLVTRWWKDYSAGSWTSITWVLDGTGTIRAVHPGGEYHDGGGADHARCRSDLAELNRTIDKLLAADLQSP